MKKVSSSFGKFLFLFISGLIPLLSQSQSLLWEISGNGLKKPSHLYGTMHLGDERILNFGPKVWPAFDKSKTLALELELDKINPLETLKAMMMDSLSLADLISEEDYEFLDSYFSDSQRVQFLFYLQRFFLHLILHLRQFQIFLIALL